MEKEDGAPKLCSMARKQEVCLQKLASYGFPCSIACHATVTVRNIINFHVCNQNHTKPYCKLPCGILQPRYGCQLWLTASKDSLQDLPSSRNPCNGIGASKCTVLNSQRTAGLLCLLSCRTSCRGHVSILSQLYTRCIQAQRHCCYFSSHLYKNKGPVTKSPFPQGQALSPPIVGRRCSLLPARAKVLLLFW